MAAGKRRTAAVAIALLVTIIVGSAPTTAGAVDAGVRWPQGPSVTWVDAVGRQWTVTQSLRRLDPPQPLWDLLVRRDTPAGQPDPTWSDDDGVAGQVVIRLDPPAEGARVDPVMAADGAGSITVIWGLPSCQTSSPCDRWFQSVDVEAAAPGVPALVTDVGEPISALPDGTVLAGTETGPLERRSASGAIVAMPVAIPAATGVWGATVDTEGRLLLATKDGTIVRQGTGGGVDLTVDSGCDPDIAIVIGPAPGGGFATACGTIDVAPTVTRWNAAGAIAWSAADGVAPAGTTGLAWPSHVAGDGDGGVWVAGRSHPDLAQTPRGVLARFTAAGPEAPAFEAQAQRPGALYGFGMGDLRPALDRHVAFAFDDRCCNTVGGPLPFDRVISGVLPDRPSPPTCRPTAPAVEGTGYGTANLGFTSCPAGRAVEDPTEYLLEVVGPDQTRSVVVDHPGPAEAVEGTVTDLRGGTLLRTQATGRNDEGDSLAGPQPGASLVLPFASVEAFTFRMYNTLLRDAWWDRDGAALVAEVESGDTTPVEQGTEMLEAGVAEARVEPVARLYLAVLGRHPDTSGLRYWVGRSEAGVRLAQIAERMADSSEFRRRYGGLGDRAFVLQLYRNVLGREGDPSGVDYWTRRLTARTLTRGGLVTQLSQSPEHVRRTDPTIQPLAASFLLLDRVTTTAERTDWATATPRATALAAIFDSAAFASRIQG